MTELEIKFEGAYVPKWIKPSVVQFKKKNFKKDDWTWYKILSCLRTKMDQAKRSSI